MPMVTIEVPSTVAMKTGNRLWTSSEDMSMNIETKPSAQMPPGRALKPKTVDNDLLFKDGAFKYVSILSYPFGSNW
jgi:hypothetical protein